VGKKGGRLNFNLKGEYRSPGLNLNDMGYIRQADFLGQVLEVSYEMNEPTNWIRNYKLDFFQQAKWTFGGENTSTQAGFLFTLKSNDLWTYMATYSYLFSHMDTRELRGGPALREDGQHLSGVQIRSNHAKDLYGVIGMHFDTYTGSKSRRELYHASLTWLPIRKIKLSAKTIFNNRKYHQQYVTSIPGSAGDHYIVSDIDHRTMTLTFRGELFLTPELSLQYYGSPYYAVGDYSAFKRVDRSLSRDLNNRLEILDTSYDDELDSYSFNHQSEEVSFENPDFGFMQFRSNLVFRWEYNLGSTLYLVWAHDRSGREGIYNPIRDITGDLFGIKGNHIFMFKLNFWFSL
jgi:hypothetical protein